MLSVLGTAADTDLVLSASESAIAIGDSFWLSLIPKIGFILVMFLLVPLIVGYMEHKVMAHQQARVGPMEAGNFHGWAQLIADGVKFIQKEEIVPRAADRWVFSMAPGIAMVPGILVFLVIPLAPGIFGQDLEMGIFYALAIGSVSALGVLVGGWASANKFSLIGALRGAAQLIAYELPLVLAVVAVVIQAGSLSLVDIVHAQAAFHIPGTEIGVPYLVPQILGVGLFFVAALAELNRPPFDMPIADSELVFGFLTEYTGIKFAMFLLYEYGGMVSMSALITVLYLGGWEIWPGVGVPFCDGAGAAIQCGVLGSFVGTLITVAKTFLLAFLMVWARVTYPRLREDQLMRLSWTVMIPLALVNIAATGVLKVVF